MSEHTHSEYVPDCYRCDLSRDEVLCGMRKPGGTATCIEPAGHNGSHGDGSVIRWIYREENPR